MSVLVGDVNGIGGVNSTDVSQTKTATSQTVSSANFRADVNATGVVNATDVSIVKAHAGTQLPGAFQRRR
ncbi:MAG: dockerin type I domain-containing protein [Chthoniobacterales bacterium]